MKKETSPKHYTAVWFIHAFIVALLFAFTNASSQDLVKPKTWQVYFENSEVLVEYKFADCNLPSEGSNNENLYLKFTNKLSQGIDVKWRNELWYNGKCHGCDENIEFKNQLSLTPNAFVEGTCSTGSLQQLTILSVMLNFDKTKLTKFDLKDITTSVSK